MHLKIFKEIQQMYECNVIPSNSCIFYLGDYNNYWVKLPISIYCITFLEENYIVKLNADNDNKC